MVKNIENAGGEKTARRDIAHVVSDYNYDFLLKKCIKIWVSFELFFVKETF